MEVRSFAEPWVERSSLLGLVLARKASGLPGGDPAARLVILEKPTLAMSCRRRLEHAKLQSGRFYKIEDDLFFYHVCPAADSRISDQKMHPERDAKLIRRWIFALRRLIWLGGGLLLACAIAACASLPRQTAVSAQPECQVEPQPLSCAGGEDADGGRAP